MQLVTAAFDVDGCLRNSAIDQNDPPVPNEDMRNILIFLSRFKNVVLYVWSGEGAEYAEETSKALGVWAYVKGSGGDFLHKMNAAASVGFKQLHFQPDIAFDNDVRNDTGKINLFNGFQGSISELGPNGAELNPQ